MATVSTGDFRRFERFGIGRHMQAVRDQCERAEQAPPTISAIIMPSDRITAQARRSARPYPFEPEGDAIVDVPSGRSRCCRRKYSPSHSAVSREITAGDTFGASLHSMNVSASGQSGNRRSATQVRYRNSASRPPLRHTHSGRIAQLTPAPAAPQSPSRDTAQKLYRDFNNI